MAFFALLLSAIYGGTIVFAQDASSNFYSTYDVRELVKNGKYLEIDCADGDAFFETTSELRGGGTESTKSIIYACRIQSAGVDAFSLAKFLELLLDETIKKIEGGKGTLITQRHMIGKRFYVEYAQDGFLGRVEVDGDMMAKDQINLDVDVIETTKK
jgi:hypothetical protein